MSACAASAGARCPLRGVWRASALSRRNLNDRLARWALPPASGPEIVRQEAAENRAPPWRKAVPGGSGRQYAPPSWRQEPPSAANSMPSRRGRNCGTSCNATGQIAFCTGGIRQVSQNSVRRHASPDRDDLGPCHDRSAVLPRTWGTCGSCAFPPGRPAWLRPGAGGLACGRAGIVVRPAVVSVTAARPSAFYPCGLCSCDTGGAA